MVGTGVARYIGAGAGADGQGRHGGEGNYDQAPHHASLLPGPEVRVDHSMKRAILTAP